MAPIQSETCNVYSPRAASEDEVAMVAPLVPRRKTPPADSVDSRREKSTRSGLSSKRECSYFGSYRKFLTYRRFVDKMQAVNQSYNLDN